MSCQVIAEAGVNHNGALSVAMSLVEAAAHAGADIIKFQTFKSEKLVSQHAPKADYQNRQTNPEESQLAMLKALELPLDAYSKLKGHAQKQGILFLSSPFDQESLHFLTQELDVSTIKLGSGEITNAPLLWAVAQTDKPIILSTGMSRLGEIEMALGVLAYGYQNKKPPRSFQDFMAAYQDEAIWATLREKVTLLHCTTEYPAPFAETNLRAIDTLRLAFGLATGLSDHTPGIAIPLAAVARGAMVIEKHFTLDKKLPGPDHQASLDPDELKKMIEGIRQIEAALGDGCKRPTLSEINNQPIARHSLVASRPIRKGEPFTTENLDSKRPGSGLNPIYYWDLLNRPAMKDYQADEVIHSNVF